MNPRVDEAYLQRVFDQLAQMQIDLDEDPLMFGPKRLNQKLALCRESLRRCELIYGQLSRDRLGLSKAIRQAENDFQIRKDDLLANNPEVGHYRNIRDREAVCNNKLRQERETISLLKTELSDLDTVLTVVKSKKEDLKDTQGRIRDQVKLCQEEVSLGMRWGSTPSNTPRVNLDKAPRLDLQALQNQIPSVEGEVTDLSKYMVDTETIQGSLDQLMLHELGPVDFIREKEREAAASSAVVDEAVSEETPVEEPVQVQEEPAHPMWNTSDPSSSVPENGTGEEDVEDFLSGMDLDTPPAPTNTPAHQEFNIDELLGLVD